MNVTTTTTHTAETVTQKNHTTALDRTTAIRNATVQVWNTHASTGTEVIPLVTVNTTTVAVTVTSKSGNSTV